MFSACSRATRIRGGSFLLRADVYHVEAKFKQLPPVDIVHIADHQFAQSLTYCRLQYTPGKQRINSLMIFTTFDIPAGGSCPLVYLKVSLHRSLSFYNVAYGVIQ